MNIQKHNKESEITVKQNEINAINQQINDVNSSIQEMRNQLNKKNYFSEALLNELEYFVKEKTWTNSSIDNENELLQEGKKAIEQVNEPIVNFSIDVVSLFDITEAQFYWDKISVGDIINIEYEKWQEWIEVRLTDYVHDIDNYSLSMTCSNASRKQDAGKFLTNTLQQVISTANNVNKKKYVWNKSEINNTWITDFISSSIDAANHNIVAGNQDIQFNKYGAWFRNKDNPNESLGSFFILNYIIYN